MSGGSLFDAAAGTAGEAQAAEAKARVGTRTYGFVLEADPVPWPRAGARIVGKPPKQFIQFYVPDEAKQHARAIRDAWRAEGHGRFDAHVPLALFAVFVFDRPAGHYGTGRNAAVVKPACLPLKPRGPGSTGKDGKRHGGDLDNLVKMVKDALSETAYVDDADVVQFEAEKLFTDQAGVAGAQTIVELRPA